ncbi:MAG: hypothetical protein AVDCRST_MAG68-1444 [uncultured Gemmatimonadetes bacterium]|uniref:Lipoprotein n=1 Tax=uncultured Gemmatimonadota bacterium TaxID=203437 RepID=A0A6J4KRW2_9BACT|nr:MAG: hypothetical protein AVDCRST_MAG68-1444 [uncultured Gemmatimonadota bacterium]
MDRLGWMVCLALAACGGAEPAPAGKDAPIVPVTSGAQGAAAPSTDTAWTVTPRGIGPVQVGTSTAEALGLEVSGGNAKESCEYVRAGRLPAGVGVMSNGGRVARVDVDSGRVATAEGARIGDSDARIRELYEGSVTEQPNENTPGHSLVFTPDPQHRIIFETDGKVVTRYRAGRMPEVEWVERCG